MARGQDTNNHPNRKVDRRTPRVAEALANMINQKLDDRYEDLMMEHSMAGYMPIRLQSVSEVDAQHAIDRYREERDKGYDVEFEKDDLREALRYKGY